MRLFFDSHRRRQLSVLGSSDLRGISGVNLQKEKGFGAGVLAASSMLKLTKGWRR